MSPINTVFGHVRCLTPRDIMPQREEAKCRCAPDLHPISHPHRAPTSVLIPKGFGRAQVAGWKTEKEGTNTSKHNCWGLCNFNHSGYELSLCGCWTHPYHAAKERRWLQPSLGDSLLLARGHSRSGKGTCQCCCLKNIFRALKRCGGKRGDAAACGGLALPHITPVQHNRQNLSPHEVLAGREKPSHFFFVFSASLLTPRQFSI